MKDTAGGGCQHANHSSRHACLPAFRSSEDPSRPPPSSPALLPRPAVVGNEFGWATFTTEEGAAVPGTALIPPAISNGLSGGCTAGGRGGAWAPGSLLRHEIPLAMVHPLMPHWPCCCPTHAPHLCTMPACHCCKCPAHPAPPHHLPACSAGQCHGGAGADGWHPAAGLCCAARHAPTQAHLSKLTRR